MSLDEIGLRHGTDKASSHHGYLDIYEREIPRTPEGSLLELGWLDGASIRMWQDWLPGWEITGLDIDSKEPIEGINFVHGSQDDQDVIDQATEYGPFDVIVDDASHEVLKTAASFLMLWSSIKPGGLYFVEDLGTAFLTHWGGTADGAAFYRLLNDMMSNETEVEQVSFWRNLCMVRKAA
jgi:demethylmacrocin O-methyltransferase